MKGLIVILGALMAFVPAPVGQDDLIVHEWGTFTSVQDSKGAVLEWRSVNDWDLPNFVYNGKTNPDSAKLDTRRVVTNSDKKEVEETVQRMETPVIFFYGKTGQQVDVNVKFPQGAFTEWYPRARDISRSSEKLESGYLRWGKVTLLDPNSIVNLPNENGYKGHYLASRDTDANIVRLCAQGEKNQDKTEYEKFLFYRGIGNFNSPVRVECKWECDKSSKYHLDIHNDAAFDISGVFVLRVKGGKASVLYFENIKAKSYIGASAPSPKDEISSEKIKKFHAQLQSALEKQGLYKKEAKAFVETWKDSYVNTDGIRVLYMLPQKYTDEILPLSISPAPDKLVRVMVGRVECITTEMTAKITELIKQLGHDSSKKRTAAKEAILKLGRFAEAALKVAIKEAKDAEIKTEAQEILKEISSIH